MQELNNYEELMESFIIVAVMSNLIIIKKFNNKYYN